MTVAFQAQDILALLVKEKKGISPAALRDKYGFEEKNMAVRFKDLHTNNYAKKIKPPAGSAKNAVFYAITPKGVNFLKANKDTVRSPAEINEVLKTRVPRSHKGAPTVPMNKKANMAIEGIAQLMDDYQHANQMLKQIYSMIGDYLANNSMEKPDEQKQS